MSRFLGASDNFLALPEEMSSDAAGVVILPFPYEATSTFGKGSSKGPQALIDASHEVELFDVVLGQETYREVGGIATFEPYVVPSLSDGDAVSSTLAQLVSGLLKAGKKVIVFGGEHTSIVGSVRAHCEHYDNLSVIQFDAHSDLRAEYQGDAWNHACAAARILDFHKDLVQVGIRSQCIEERMFQEEKGIPVFYAHQIHEDEFSGKDWIGEIISQLRDNVYVTFDCDVFDPSVVPATGTPEPGGLTWNQVERFFARLCKARRLVGLDVNELAPIEGMNFPQFTVAKLVYRVLGYAFS